MYARLTFDQAIELPRSASGLTSAPVWVEIGGCPVWRGYDPDRQPEHAAGEAAFIAEHEAQRHYVDRCSCGGLMCMGGDNGDVYAMDCGGHYPQEFMDGPTEDGCL